MKQGPASVSRPSLCQRATGVFDEFAPPAGAAPRYRALNRNLNVPCGCARNVISGANMNTLPFPIVACTTSTPPVK